jgi:DNA-binding CsgD family transcriptional regulator
MTATVDCLAEIHGTRAAYWRGCRHPEAREEYRIYRKRLREGRAVSPFIDSTGTARRLQSLVASGHRQGALAGRMGFSGERLNQLIWQKKPTVSRRMERRVKDLFHLLDGTDGGSRYALTAAKRNGWVDAAAWDNIDDPTETPKLGERGAAVVDEVAVQRAANGDQLPLNPRERLLAVEILTRRLMSQTEIAERLGITPRSVCRTRARARELAAA